MLPRRSSKVTPSGTMDPSSRQLSRRPSLAVHSEAMLETARRFSAYGPLIHLAKDDADQADRARLERGPYNPSRAPGLVEDSGEALAPKFSLTTSDTEGDTLRREDAALQRTLERAPSEEGGTSTAFSETPEQYRARWTSLWIAFTVTFLLTIQNSIYWNSLWPYLSTIDAGASETFFGLTLMVFNLASAIASPLFGYWANRVGRCRPPIIAGISLTIVGNLLFAFVEAIPVSQPRWLVLAARFVTGFGIGNYGALYAYVVMASTLKERNKAVGVRAAVNSAAIMIGPGLQSAFVFIGYPGWVVGNGLFHFNTYTLPAWVNIALGFLQIGAMMTLFKESWISVASPAHSPPSSDESSTDRRQHRVCASSSSTNGAAGGSSSSKDYTEKVTAALGEGLDQTIQPLEGSEIKSKRVNNYEGDSPQLSDDTPTNGNGFTDGSRDYSSSDNPSQQQSSEVEVDLRPYDKLAVGVCIWTRLAQMFCFTYDTTIGSPLTMAMFKWSPSDAVFYNGIIQIVAASTDFCGNLIMGNFVLNYVKERAAILLGISSFMLFFIVSFPWPGLPPMIPVASEVSTGWPNATEFSTILTVNPTVSTASGLINSSQETSTKFEYVCDYTWCPYTTRISLWQYLLAYGFLVFSISVAFTPNATLFSKILGPRKQGTLQGIFAASGQLAMTIAPLLVSVLFDNFGPRVTNAVGFGVLFSSTLLILVTYRRLVPWNEDGTQNEAKPLLGETGKTRKFQTI